MYVGCFAFRVALSFHRSSNTDVMIHGGGCVEFVLVLLNELLSRRKFGGRLGFDYVIADDVR